METITETRDVDVEVEVIIEETTESAEVKHKAESEYRFSESTRRYAKTSVGIAGMVAFAFIPFITMAGMIIITIIAEIYIADWTYSAFRGRDEENTSERVTSNVEDERSKVVTTTSTKDQFIK